MINNLAIVVPVYNEQENIVRVIKVWEKKIISLNIINYKFIIIDDGSTDNTIDNLKKIEGKKIEIYSTKNQGHGNACLYGYQISINMKYDWTLQIDSDDQCNPIFFDKFFKLSQREPIIFGYRYRRMDGFIRYLASRLLSILIFLKSYDYLPDVNVPYRLIKTKLLEEVISHVPHDVILKNAYLSVVIKKRYKRISYIPIIFDQRFSGKSKYNFKTMIFQLFNLLKKI